MGWIRGADAVRLREGEREKRARRGKFAGGTHLLVEVDGLVDDEDDANGLGGGGAGGAGGGGGGHDDLWGGVGGGRSTGGARSKSERGAKESHDSYFKLSSVRKKYTKVDKY